MTGQLLALLLLGLVAAHAIGLSVVLTNGERIHVISRDQMAAQAALAWRLATLPPEQARQALAVASPATDSYRLTSVPDIDETHQDGRDQEILASRLQALLDLPPEAIRISLFEPDDAPADLRIALRTPAGLWLTTLQHPVLSQGWLRPLRFSVPVSTLPVLLIVAVFLRRILRPIKALAQAAECVSHGEQVAPLPVTGPLEAREVTSAFNLMQQRLHRFVEDRTRMLAAISHDLRTPITSLRLRAELVDDEMLRAAMIRTLDEMRVMVEETLRFARDDAHGEATQEIDLQALMRGIVEEQVAQGRDVRLAQAPSLPLPYRCRPVHLKRALSNLADNAAHYGQRARLSLLPQADGAIHISIDDDGPGIDAQHLEEVFKPFVRLDPARHRGQQVNHVGLGLAIARSCIEAHGGRLALHNRDEGGLRALVQLPA
ncbi:ATP-binding protein [Herbaspirillum sp. NPDC087042]|uniref:ATP-binding protein n=1 Tax=Herbaspirillum sp. NPDC087042 TaxID=3364004 RepID=UPI003800F891